MMNNRESDKVDLVDGVSQQGFSGSDLTKGNSIKFKHDRLLDQNINYSTKMQQGQSNRNLDQIQLSLPNNHGDGQVIPSQVQLPAEQNNHGSEKSLVANEQHISRHELTSRSQSEQSWMSKSSHEHQHAKSNGMQQQIYQADQHARLKPRDPFLKTIDQRNSMTNGQPLMSSQQNQAKDRSLMQHMHQASQMQSMSMNSQMQHEQFAYKPMTFAPYAPFPTMAPYHANQPLYQQQYQGNDR